MQVANYLFNILISQSTDLNERDIVLLGQIPAFPVSDLSPIMEISLISHQYHLSISNILGRQRNKKATLFCNGVLNDVTITALTMFVAPIQSEATLKDSRFVTSYITSTP